MIKHIVFLKFKPDASIEQRHAIIEELRALPKQIDVIREYEVGEDVLRSPRSWDAALIGTYDSLETLKIYNDHPAHVAVVQKIREISEASSSVDFEF
ncbi:MAG TPA: Dabb family protein [Blastocatellia bacterium]|nr:Dabb family protein [Blastocatellia bacterium]